MKDKVKEGAAAKLSWHQIIFKYNQPSVLRSIWQIVNSVIPFLVVWYIMFKAVEAEMSYWITLALSILASGFAVRIFIIFHDCGHSSFFKSNKWNTVVGMFLGLFSFTPFFKWKRGHDTHHQTVGNLDKRGVGDVLLYTVEEYRKMPKAKKRFYQFYRHPLVMFLIGGIFIFLLQNRFTKKERSAKEHINVHLTTLVLAVIVVFISLAIGFKEFVMIELPILVISSAAGVSLFYIQHQFEKVIWERKEKWDYKRMAIEGSSYFKLPKILQWFTGNIGIHHIHHLGPKIPNYYLQKCLDENEDFQIEPITIKNSFGCMKLRLWDENRSKIISFKELDPNAA